MLQVEAIDNGAGPTTGVDASERAAACRARSGLFLLLGRCLEEEVDEALLELLRGPLGQHLRAAGADFGPAFESAAAPQLLAKLAEEFTGLFVAPGAVTPYASVFETGCIFQEPATLAHRVYRAAGFDYRRRHSGEFADHIGTMLAFIGRLAAAEAEALEAGRGQDAERWREQRERFTLEQLAHWAPGWCERARRCARHDFYRALLELVERVLWAELEALADRRRLRELHDLNRRPPVTLDYDADFRKASGL